MIAGLLLFTLAFSNKQATAVSPFAWTVQPHKRLAIARTFVSADFDGLAESFHKWPNPCENGLSVSLVSATSPKPDLFLVYSGDLAKDEKLLRQVEEVTELIGAAYSQCFGKVEWLSCFIPKDGDTYKPHLRHVRPDWVNGPNRQFEITFRMLQSMGYDNMFLMEPDTVPLKPFWLDLLVREIENKAPFSSLGSQYKGDKWDAFKKQLPDALLRHINGNAVYNLKDPVLDRIVQQLEREVNTTGNGVPYDYRIAQFVVEAKEGVAADLPSYPGVADPATQDIIDYLGFDESSMSKILKTTNIIGNYAETNMMVEYFAPDEVFVHGARMFQSWKTSPHTGSLTLVVSDYTGETPYKELLLQVNQIETLPFHRILLAVPFATDMGILDQVPIDLPVDVFDREPNKDSLRDYCDVLPSLNTEWFMLTDSHVRMVSKLSLMVTEDEGKPLVSFADADVAKCYEDDFCTEELLASHVFVPGNDRVFRNDDTVFSVAVMKEYCAALVDPKHGSDSSGGELLPPRPSATGYFAFLEHSRRNNGGASTMYAFSDRADRGSRLIFRPYLTPTVIEQPLDYDGDVDPTNALVQHQRFLQSFNTTVCANNVGQVACESVPSCVWNAGPGTCSERVSVTVQISITVGPVDSTTPTAADRNILIVSIQVFFARTFNTVVNVNIISITFVPAARRMLQTGVVNGFFDVEYEVIMRLTETLTVDNVEANVETVLTNNAQEIVKEIATTAANTQGPVSSLDKADSIKVEDVVVEKIEPCANVQGIYFLFCVIAKAFGSFAGFIKWVLNILTFGIFK